jgi:Protein of unknown function (DUF3618)
MDEGTRSTGPELSSTKADASRSPEEIRTEIEQTREELGDTVEALAAKTDVKARVHERVEETKETITEKTPDSVQGAATTVIEKLRANPVPALAAGGLALAFLIGRRSARP